MFLNFRISNALNKRTPLPEGLQKQIERLPEARSCVAAYQDLGRRLKSGAPKPSAPATLHSSIMHAVRLARPETENSVWSPLFRLLPASGLALLLLLAVVGFGYFRVQRISTAVASPLATAGMALELGSSIVEQAPVVALSPMLEEVQRLDQDLAATQQFILATLP